MFNRLTINSISLFISILILLVAIVLLWGMGVFNLENYSLFNLGLIVFAFPLATFLIVRMFLSFLVFPRLRLIHKVISETSKSKSEKIGANTNLNIVNKEVLEWAAKRKNDIEDFKKLEKYRKNYIGNISHELKTPLFSIQGYLHTLLDGGLEDQSVNRRYIKKAIDNAERLQYIVDDLEIINMLESDSTLDKSEFSIKHMIEDVISDIELVSKEKSIKITIDKAPKKGLWVEADKKKIRQVIENLLTNSIKYGIENGKTKISLQDLDETIRIDISDDGIGIAEKHIKHLFDRFYRVDKSRARNLGGSGLGLSIVKHILEAHNVKISVKSIENQGSTFSFALPKMKYVVQSE